MVLHVPGQQPAMGGTVPVIEERQRGGSVEESEQIGSRFGG
jgi:hypothetical protein